MAKKTIKELEEMFETSEIFAKIKMGEIEVLQQEVKDRENQMVRVLQDIAQLMGLHPAEKHTDLIAQIYKLIGMGIERDIALSEHKNLVKDLMFGPVEVSGSDNPGPTLPFKDMSGGNKPLNGS